MKKLPSPDADKVYWLLGDAISKLDKVSEHAFVHGLDGLVDDIGDLVLEVVRLREDVALSRAPRRLRTGISSTP